MSRTGVQGDRGLRRGSPDFSYLAHESVDVVPTLPFQVTTEPSGEVMIPIHAQLEIIGVPWALTASYKSSSTAIPFYDQRHVIQLQCLTRRRDNDGEDSGSGSLVVPHRNPLG